MRPSSTFPCPLLIKQAGIAAKRERKGRVNTMMHARAMLLATALSLGGW